MIRVSDNESATSVFRRLGAKRLVALARRAGMRSFSVGASWGSARLTAADAARFFLKLDALLPAATRRLYARYLLANVAPLHSWGIPQAARPDGWRVFFKGGWRPEREGDIVHQAGLLERRRRRVALAVMTDRNPSEAYGRESVRGVAERLLRAPRPGRPSAPVRPGRLAPLPALAGYRPPPARPLRPIAAGAPRLLASSGK
jgi:hypothetical protein